MNKNNVILFDGECNFCNRSVNYLLQVDSENNLLFSALNSSFSKEIKRNHPYIDSIDSILYFKNGAIHSYSSAIIEIGKDLGGLYKLLAITASIFPQFILDYIYKSFAKRRLQIFRKKYCIIPTKRDINKFIT